MTRACPAWALALVLWALPAAAAAPHVPSPPHADTVGTSAPEAPMIVPGRAAPPDTSRERLERSAQEQYAIGRQLERTGHPAAAIAAYDKAAHIDPTIPDAHYRMGRLFSAVSQHAAAAKQYRAELRVRPDHTPSSRWLGLELAQLGDTATAIAQLRALVQRRPEDEPSWQALGFALATAGRADEGAAALRRALALDPSDGDAWRDLGVVRAAQHDDAGARDAYARAARLLPKDGGVLVNLGNLERRLGNREAALADYRASVARDSTSALGWRGQVTMLTELGRTDEAARIYRRWLAIDPGDQPLRVQAMEFFDGLGRKDVALELGREGVRIAPKSAEAHLALGMALHENGDLRGALPVLRRAEELFVHHESAARVGALIRSMREKAPDSLRTMFVADSLRFEASRPSVPADSGLTKPSR